MRRCRSCRAPKWGTDPCANAECPRNTTTGPLKIKARSLPITATSKHGYHAVNTTGFIQSTSDYDAPITARGWRKAG